MKRRRWPACLMEHNKHKKIEFFMKFRHLTRATGATCKPWPGSNFFYIIWIELGFCMRKVMTSMAGGKILSVKRPGSFMRNLRFCVQILYIVCTSIATQHACCHKEYYSPRGRAVSTSHIVCTPIATQHAHCHKSISLQEAEPSLRVIYSFRDLVEESLATGGKPSTWFPPGGLVETVVAKLNINESKSTNTTRNMTDVRRTDCNTVTVMHK